MTDRIYLAYININGQTWPQKWFGDHMKGTGGLQRGAVGHDPRLIALHVLPTDQERLDLDTLTRIYPPPKVET